MIVWDMTDGEIITNFRQAKDRRAQIRIIADMNAVPVTSVIAKLIALGFKDECLFDKQIAWIPWAREDVITLVEMRAEAASFEEISKVVHRSPDACQRKYYELKGKAKRDEKLRTMLVH